MGKIYVVVHVWYYNGCPDDFANTYEEHHLKHFRRKEDAMFYAQKLIAREIRYWLDDENVDERYMPIWPPEDWDGEEFEYVRDEYREHNYFSVEALDLF